MDAINGIHIRRHTAVRIHLKLADAVRAGKFIGAIGVHAVSAAIAVEINKVAHQRRRTPDECDHAVGIFYETGINALRKVVENIAADKTYAAINAIALSWRATRPYQCKTAITAAARRGINNSGKIYRR